ncbi:MAG: hypothetical protein L0H59_07615 [Tomitella sp.]|nr:hypothetical protein [Tomitella sp.]
MTSMPHPSLAALDTIDWDDTSSILNGCTPLFAALSDDRALLTGLVAGIADDAGLAELCESYDFMQKLVLYDAPTTGVRLRLHLYEPGFFDRPHNHRWSFASHILRGGYRHRIYGRDDNFGEDTDPAGLVPIHERLEHPGSTYALHHTSVHTVQAEADTVSLLVRGPAAKNRFLILDAAAGGFFWVYGAAHETPEQRAAKRQAPDRLAATLARAQHLIAGLDPASLPPTADRKQGHRDR